jgi:signal transduction histidine kinase
LKLKESIFFILFLLSFCTALLIENFALKDDFLQQDANALLRRKLNKKLVKQEQLLSDSNLIGLIDGFDLSKELYKDIKNQQVSVFAYKHKCLVFWTDNLIQPYNFPCTNTFKKEILHNKKGWFQMLSLHKNGFDIYCYYQFYHAYPFNNAYFVDAFNSELSLNNVSLTTNEEILTLEPSGYTTHSNLPEISQSSFSGKRKRQMLEFFYSISFAFFMVFSLLLASKRQVFNARKFVITIMAFVSVFSFLAFFNVVLKHKSDIELFSPDLAAYSASIPSLGHCILLMVAIVSALVVLHQLISTLKQKSHLEPNKFIYSGISSIQWVLNYLVVFVVLPKYILNSRINYDFKLLANVDENTLIGLLNVFFFFFVIILSNRILSNLVKHKINQTAFLKFHIAIGLTVAMYAHFFDHTNGFLLICFSVFGFLLPFWLIFIKKLLFRHIIGLGLLCAAIFSVQFEQLNSFKEKEHRKLFATKLIAKEDIDLEFKLLDIEEEMVHTEAIDSLFYYTKNDYNELELNYRYTFFNDFIKNYDISLMRYDSFGADITPNKLSYAYANSLYNQSTNKSISNYFLYIKDLHYLGGYLAKYEICPGKRNIGYVFLLLTPKVKSDLYNLDYFFNKMDYNSLADNRYSYAIYQNNELIKSLGSYPYTLNNDLQYSKMEDESFMEVDGYSQLLKKINAETFIIVSLKSATWNQIFTVFTFILLYFTSVLVLVFIGIYALIFLIGLLGFNARFQKVYGVITKYLRVININKLYLETKIRLSFLLMSVLICSVVVYFTVQNVNKSFKEKQNESLDKKMSQIVSELELGYSKRDERPIQNLIKHLANTYEVDINLYFKDGTLYQTANNRIYDESWFSPYLHPLAHYELIQRKQYNLKQVERIGLLEYQSYYNALFDANRNLIGYVHLPYFSKSLDLKNEFSSYLGSLLNISALLLMISLLIASYIGQSLVRPLNLMISSLAKIKLGEQNQLINWSRNDEIGQLVDQYNVMLKKLELSTEKLARSEREGAWKEMAKQVAHEIKNPLTPMKLHLQHLQMSLHKDDAYLKEKIASISQILIDQIDQLSNMAEEFSSFAKMPMALPEVQNINQILNSSIVLFRSQSHLEIDFVPSDEILLVMVDKDQITRVFTNILKNAQQATEENEICKIQVKIELIENNIDISFTDNGKGIEDELKDKIFQPNFSTKNSGMGLGLAICKKIIEQVHGTITFESELNKGTTFHVILPVYQSDSSLNI